MAQPIPELIPIPPSTDPGLDQSHRALMGSLWSLQRDHGYVAHNTGLGGTGETFARGYQASPQVFRTQRTVVAAPSASESNWLLPGRNPLVNEE